MTEVLADCNQANGSWRDQDIKNAFDISTRTIARVRQRFVEEGLWRLHLQRLLLE